MKSHPLFSLLISLLFTTGTLSATTPPPNDNLANAILLSGDSFTHTTEVHCATVEPDELPYRRFPVPFNDALLASLEQRTVWWKWVAPNSPASTGLQVNLTSSAPPSNSYIPHIEVMAFNGPTLEGIQVIYIGIDQPFIALPGRTYYFRGFYSPDPGTTQPDNVTLTITGQNHVLASNRGIENSIPMIGNSIPEGYAPFYTTLFYTWTPDTTGYPVMENTSPTFATAQVYPEGEAFETLEGPVIAGETYTVSFYTGSTTQSPLLIGGDFNFLPPADNSTFEGRKPVVANVLDDRTELSLTAEDYGREFWWTFTPTEDGLLKTTTTSYSPLLRVKVFENEQNETPISIARSSLEVTANTTYTISLRTNTGQITDGIDETFTFYPTSDAVNITDPILGSALRLAFDIAPDAPVPQAFLTDLSNLRIRAFRDCDDDDCGAPGFTISDLGGLETAHNLQTLYLQGGEYEGHNVSSLAPIKGLTKLTTVRLPNALKGTDEELQTAIEDLSELEQLTWLSLEQNALTNSHLEPISALTRLETLDIDDNLITDLTPISSLTLIETLDIDDNPLVDLSPLASLQKLRDLDVNPINNGLTSLPPLRDIRRIKVMADDLGPLARLTNIQGIELPTRSKLSTTSRLRDLTPIANLPNLTYVSDQLYSNAVRDFRPVLLMDFIYPSYLTSILTNMAHNSKADPSDPATAELFATANINPSTILLTPDDPTLMVPDGKLRWYMSFRPSTTPTTDPTQAQFDSLTFLYGTHVESLEGIDNAPNLNSITLFDGWISDLTPLSGLTNLSTLTLANNFITDVTPIAHLTNVSINLTGNPINPATIPAAWIDNPLIKLDPSIEPEPSEDIPDPTLRSLIRVALGMRPDDPLVSADLVNLRTLHADLAKIKSLDGLEAATNLVGLSLRNNILTDLTPIPTGNLRWLRVSGNPLDAASLTLLTTLEGQGVIVDNNEETRFLSAITPSNNVVFADDYQLPSVRYLQLFPDVTTLFLSHNYLSDIPELADLPNLETVYLEGNFLLLEEGDEAKQIIDDLRAAGVTVHTDPQRPETTGEVIVEQDELREATADGLNLPYIPPSFSQAQLDTIINFDWENSVGTATLDDPSFISQMGNLEFLSLENAGLTDITFLQNLTKLKRLDLDFNQISDIQPLQNMTDLQELDFNDNLVRDISTLSNFPQLISLDIDNNCIANIDSLSGLNQLLELQLQYNKIKDITPIVGLDQLEILDIHLNQIDYTQPTQATAFSNLESLLDFPILYPQHFAKPSLSIEGTNARLEWIAEQKTYYQVRFATTLEGPFQHIYYITPSAGGQPIEIDYNSGSPKGFFKITPIPNPYQ